MGVELRCQTRQGRSYGRRLLADARVLMRLARLEQWELSLLLVGDRGMRRLNRDFRRKDEPTDVLSFPQQEETAGLRRGVATGPLRPAPLLGDIVISIDTARRQALETGGTPAARLRRLLVHGFLHLLGYDHERSPRHARRMFARERAMEKRLSVLEVLEQTVASGRPGAARKTTRPQRRTGR